MAELEILTLLFKHIKTGAATKANIIYAGAAPGIHTPLLLKLFPNTVWYLYDPSPFCHTLKPSNRVHLFNEFFTDDVATSYKNKCDIFISDIRISPDEISVAENMASQEKWTRIMNPKIGTSLKFRPPYIADTETNYTLKCLKGNILWQMWPPKASTETRLLINHNSLIGGKFQTMDLDVVKYQNACSYHNTIIRPFKRFHLPSPDLITVPGYDCCFDCTCEAICWMDYNKLKSAIVKLPSKHMEDLTHVTSQKINSGKNGSIHGIIDVDLLEF